MFLTQAIHSNSNQFLTLCNSHKVNKLYAFGSSVTDNFDPRNSDIDLLVEIKEKDPVKKGDILLDFFIAIENFFKRKIDLLTDQPIQNPFLKESVDASKILIYDGERQEILI